MNGMNLSENIIRLRRKRKLTQEQLADFVGVTKAAVSKWETAQSIPDILLLPRLASLFDVTVDELIGYRPSVPGSSAGSFTRSLRRILSPGLLGK